MREISNNLFMEVIMMIKEMLGIGKDYGKLIDYIENRREYRDEKRKIEKLLDSAIDSAKQKNNVDLVSTLRDISYTMTRMDAAASNIDSIAREAITGDRYL